LTSSLYTRVLSAPFEAASRLLRAPTFSLSGASRQFAAPTEAREQNEALKRIHWEDHYRRVCFFVNNPVVKVFVFLKRKRAVFDGAI
jgi:hypothetical protein